MKNKKKPLTFSDYISSGAVVVVFAVFAVSVALIQNIFLAAVLGLLAAWGFTNLKHLYFQKNPPVVIPDPLKASDEIVDNILTKYDLDELESDHPDNWSVDGLRWSQKVVVTTKTGSKHVFMARGLLINREGWLEEIPEESDITPESLLPKSNSRDTEHA